jgi:hypothetical protein
MLSALQPSATDDEPHANLELHHVRATLRSPRRRHVDRDEITARPALIRTKQPQVAAPREHGLHERNDLVAKCRQVAPQ